jgi:antitoxin YefM
VLEVNLSEDVYPISAAQESLRRIVEKAANTQRPMVITQRGRPVAALVEIGEFERLRRLAEVAEDYREIIAGQDGPWLAHETVWKEVAARIEQANAPQMTDVDAAATS